MKRTEKMQDSISLIKERLPIEEVIGSYIKVDRAGRSLKARCPFHNEKTPSFFISPDRGTYYCFGCGEKGDIFSFVQAFEGLDFMGALKTLAERANVPLNSLSSKRDESKERLYRILEAATVFFEKNLERNKEALEYLEKRGLVLSTIKNWRLGYAPLAWRDLYEILLTKGITKSELIEVGLIKEKEGDKNTVFDRFRGRIMFPIFDASGRVIGFSGRLLKEEKDGLAPKYLNSPETPLFHKSEVLYGFNEAKREMRATSRTILVEGQMDLLMAHQAGYKNTIATSGTALSATHIDLIRRFSTELLVSYDDDNAGRKAALKVWTEALHSGLEVKLISLPKDSDPADCILNNIEIWKKAIASPEHIIDYSLFRVLEEKDNEKIRERIRNEILPLIISLPSAIEKAHYVGKISEVIKVKEQAVWDDVNKIAGKVQGSFSKSKNEIHIGNLTRLEGISRRIYGIIWNLEKNEGDMANKKEKEIERFFEKPEILEALKNKLVGKKEDVMFEVEVLIGEEKFESEWKELIKELEVEILQNKLIETMRELTIAEKAHDKKKAEDLLLICQSLGENISRLKGQSKV